MTQPLASVEAALAGGCRWLQYRDKTAALEQQVERAGQLSRLCRRYGAVFIINDNTGLALQVEADGVHLGRDDGDLSAARQALSAGKILGASCYNELQRAKRAVTEADYLAFGSVFASHIKPNAVRADLSLFVQARDLGPTLCAIGGITPNNVAALIAAGVKLVAVSSALFGRPEEPGLDAVQIEARAAAFCRLFQ